MGRSGSGIQGDTFSTRKEQKGRRNHGKAGAIPQTTQRKASAQIVAVTVWLTIGFLLQTTYSLRTEAKREKDRPQFLLTPHYGILSPEELQKDAQNNGNSFWQCFPTKSVSVGYEKWKDSHPMGSSSQPVEMCVFGIKAKHDGVWSEFVGRRANELEVCTKLVTNWNRLTTGEQFVCINGEGMDFKKQAHEKGLHSWTWLKLKTKKGCYAYFPDDCP